MYCYFNYLKHRPETNYLQPFNLKEIKKKSWNFTE